MASTPEFDDSSDQQSFEEPPREESSGHSDDGGEGPGGATAFDGLPSDTGEAEYDVDDLPDAPDSFGGVGDDPGVAVDVHDLPDVPDSFDDAGGSLLDPPVDVHDLPDAGVDVHDLPDAPDPSGGEPVYLALNDQPVSVHDLPDAPSVTDAVADWGSGPVDVNDLPDAPAPDPDAPIDTGDIDDVPINVHDLPDAPAWVDGGELDEPDSGPGDDPPSLQLRHELEQRTGISFDSLVLSLGRGPIEISPRQLEKELLRRGDIKPRIVDNTEPTVIDNVLTPHPTDERIIRKEAFVGKESTVDRLKDVGQAETAKTVMSGLMGLGTAGKGVPESTNSPGAEVSQPPPPKEKK